MIPQRELEGLDEVRDGDVVGSGKTLGVEFKERKLTDLGDGRIVANVHEVYRVRGTGDFAFERDPLDQGDHPRSAGRAVRDAVRRLMASSVSRARPRRRLRGRGAAQT